MALNKWITRIDVSFFRSTGTCQKIGLLSHYRAENEKYSSTQMLILLSLVTSTCYHRLTLVLPIAYSLTPTRKLNGKTRVHTVFFLDSFGQEMPTLVLVKIQYFHSFSISVTRCRIFGTRHSSSTRVRAREKNLSIG
jgi:hypothetical protein